MKRKIVKLFLISMMIFALTITDFLLLGQSIVIAIYEELETQSSSTNVKNVEFNAYFAEEEKQTHSKRAEINSDQTLILDINVKEKGVLNDGKIKIENANFKILKDKVQNNYVKNINVDTNEIELNTIVYQNHVKIELPIQFNKQEIFGTDYFDKENTISLTGIYKDMAEREVNGSVKTRMIWTQSTDVTVTQAIEKYTNVDEKQSLLQQVITTEVPNNVLPREKENLTIQVPILGEKKPVSVIVLYNGEKLAEEKIVYSSEKQTVEVENQTFVNEQNQTTWGIAKNEYKIIYLYEGKAVEGKTAIELKTTSKTKLYTADEIQKEDIQTVAVEKIGNIVSSSKQATGELAKGYLYANVSNQTVFEERNEIEISNANAINSIEIQKEKEVFENEQDKEFVVTNGILYRNTTISKNNFVTILGENGQITIKDNNDDILATINKDSETDENGLIVISYEGEVTALKITTSKPEKEGKLIFTHTRAIKGDTGYTKELLKEMSSLVIANRVTTELGTEIAEAKINLKDTKTQAKLELSNTNLSTLQTNENMQFLVNLISNSEKYDLYKNPMIEIVLPKELKIKVKNITQLNRQEELKIVNPRLYTNNNGEQVIQLPLQGEQTSFENNINEGIQISITAAIMIQKETPTKDVAIKMNYTNENRRGETFSTEVPVKLNSKYGVLMVNKLSNLNANSDTIESIDDTMKTVNVDRNAEERIITQDAYFVNNYEHAITDTSIIGKIPEVGDLKTTFAMKLLAGIAVEGKEAKVYYSEDFNATKESDSWKETVEDFSKVKAFKIELENARIEPQEVVKISYQLQIPANLKEEEISYSSIYLDYSYAGDKVNSSSIVQFITEPKEEVISSNENTVLASEKSEGMSMELSGRTGGKGLAKNQEIFEGQGIKYILKITNNSDKDITNIKVNATQTNAIFYDEIVYNDGWDSENNIENTEYSHEEENPNLKVKEMVVEKLPAGETIEISYQFSVKEVEGENETTSGKIEISADGYDIKEMNTFTNPIKQAELKLQMRDKYEVGDELQTNGIYPFFFDVKNISGENKNDILVEFEVPKGFTFDTSYLFDPETGGYEFLSYKDNILSLKIPTLDAGATLSIRLTLAIDPMELEIASRNYNFIYTATLGEKTYFSNERSKVVYNMSSKITITQEGSIEGEEVKNGDKLNYIVTVANQGESDKDIFLSDSVPKGAVVSKVTAKFYQITEMGDTPVETKEIENFTNNHITYEFVLKSNQKCILTIETTIDTEKIFTEEITNTIDVATLGQVVKCNEITYKVKQEVENPDPDPDNPDPDNPDPDNPDPEMIFNITGTVWEDKNKNGLREISEDTIEGMEVIAIDETTGEIVKDKNGNEKTARTDKNGRYEFKDMLQGKYTVVFKYNANQYRITEYQKEGVSENGNSDVIGKTIELDGKQQEVAITRTLEIKTSNLDNIDAGFIQREKFDLRLEKYIQKIIVQNKKGTTVKEYEKEKLAKLELDAKLVAGTTVIIEYKIDVTNEGELAGYVNEIVDYKPKDLIFSSEMNKNWYQSTDGDLHTNELSNQIIKPGETKTLSLTVTKSMNQNNTGTIVNQAEIEKTSNDFSIEDIDSIPGNKINQEDDMSTAELIISIRTGSAVTYIMLFIIIIAIVATGIYLIKEKVLKEELEERR